MPEVRLYRGEPIEKAIRQLRRKMKNECVMDELRSRREYVKPSLKRRLAKGLVR